MVTVGILAQSSSGVYAQQAAGGQAKIKSALSVEVIEPTYADWSTKIALNGNVSAWQEASVGVDANGLRIVAIKANVGDRVKKGQILAELQSESVSADLEQAKAGLMEAEALFNEAKADADRARELEKTEALSKQEVNKYLTAEKTSLARMLSLKAQVKNALYKFSQTKVIAPDDGTITARTGMVGLVVNSGTELFRMIRKDKLEWKADAPSTELAKIRVGQAINILDGTNSNVLTKVRQIGPTIERQTRNGTIYADLPNVGNFRAGMFIRGEIETQKGRVLVIPQTAVMMKDGFNYVFKVGVDSRALKTKVSIGQINGNQVSILSGIDAKTAIVGSGVGFLVDGDSVKQVTKKAN